jgi:hypothetical protein
MKDLFKDPDLWRQKRAELPVDSEPQSGWQEMQSILDKHLPVLPLTAAPHVSKLAKIIKAVKAMKVTSILIASLTVATVTGTAIYLINNEQHKNASHRKSKKHSPVMGKDSLVDSLTANSSNLNDSPDIVRDSLNGLKEKKNEQSLYVNKNDSIINPAKTNPASNSSKSKANGLFPISTVNNQQTISARQKGNSNIIKSRLTGSNGYNNGSSALPGKYRNTKQFGPTGNQTAQQVLTNGIDATNKNNLADNQAMQDGSPASSTLTPYTNANLQSWQLTGINNNTFIRPQVFANQPLSKFVIGNYYYSRLSPLSDNKISNSKNKTGKNRSATGSKTKRTNSLGRSLSTAFANTDWGILLGVNSSGSFTPGAQNSNFYGSFPVDIYVGLFGTYHLNNKWAINAQVRLLTPLNLSGSYTNENTGVDSAKLVKVTDSRKAYFVSIPVHAVYKITNNISVKGGPVINIPVKQINSITNVRRLTDNIDTIFLANTVNQLKTTRYDQKINLGLSGGISFQFNRLSLEALYQKSLGGYNIASGFGNYKTNPGTVQISVGFKLNSLKHH